MGLGFLSMQTHPPRRWLLAAVLALAACREPAPVRPPAALPFMQSGAVIAQPLRHGPTRASADFKAFALNALLVPLLDDDLPSRWADPSLSVECEHTRVTVDGALPDVGAPVPRDGFTLRWQMERCNPLDGYFELSGEVEIRVEPGAGGYTAVVHPMGLQVISTEGVEVLDQPFTARLGVGP